MVHPLQPYLDYVFALGALGVSGFFRKWRYGLQIGYVAGVLGRFFFVFLSGVIFFYMYAPEGQHAIVYSAIYNASYIVPEMIFSLVIISLPSMKHAINVVTRSIVPPAVYAQMVAANSGSVSVTARLVTGAVIGAIGGMAFVFAGHIRRLELFSVMQYITGSELFYEAPRRIPRMIGRNTEHILAFQTVGVLFLAVGAAFLISVLAKGINSEINSKIDSKENS